MPFWLCENRLVGLLRSISLQKQMLITLGCMLITAGSTILLKQIDHPPATITNQRLKKIINCASSEKMQQLASADRTPVSLHAIPQTLSFFTTAGFHVCTVERFLGQQAKRAAGYIVSVQGSFDTLMHFLTANKHVPATLLSLQTLSRINDSMLDIEFFIPKRNL